MSPLLIVLIVLMAAAAIWKLVGQGGKTKVFAEIYELQGTSLVRLNPKGASVCHIKKDEGINKLFLPKRYTQKEMKGLQIPDHGDYIHNTLGLKLIQVLKVNEGDFKLLKPDIDLQDIDFPSNKYTIIDRDVAFWADNEAKRIEIDHKVEGKWEKLKPYLMLGAVVIGAVIILWGAMDKAENLVLDAKDYNEDTKSWFEKITADPTKLANSVNRNSVDEPTDSPKPPGG